MASFNDKFIPRDANLRQYATDRQWEVLETYWREGSAPKAVRALGLKHKSSVSQALKAVLKRAARAGYMPQHPNFNIPGGVPDGYKLWGQTPLVNADGTLSKRWDKTRLEGMDPAEARSLPDPKRTVKLATLTDNEGRVIQQWNTEKPEDVARETAWADYARALAVDLPRLEPVAAPAGLCDDLCVGIPVGDLHAGLLAWHEENGGANYDLEECERLFMGAIDRLIEATPAAAIGVLAVLGDFSHYDSLKPVTPAHGNQLDADSRPAKMVRVALRLLRYAAEAMRRRYGLVHIIFSAGNHDPYTAIFMREALATIYEDEPRVTVDTSPRLYHYYVFGLNLLGVHHGDKTKLQDLPLIMAADRREEWGRTRYRYWWTGHVHHDQVKDIQGVRCESFRVLPPPDAWADGAGYRSMRDIKAIVFHKEYGEVARHTVNPEMLL